MASPLAGGASCALARRTFLLLKEILHLLAAWPNKSQACTEHIAQAIYPTFFTLKSSRESCHYTQDCAVQHLVKWIFR